MSAQHQSAEVKARANQTKNQVLSHPYVQQGAAVANQYAVRLDKHLSQYPILNKAEEKTRIPKVYGVLSTAGAFIFLIFFNLFGLASPLSNLIGWAIPAYLSVQALESPGKNDDKQWLTYWVVFGLFNFVESAALRPILYYFPFYFVSKTLFISWLMSPQFRGAEILYHNVVRKAFLSLHQQQRTGYPTASSTPGYTTTTSSYAHAQ
ncbi:TB2/DP1, HVA22 family-domain-containing protein [Filobasidium floriforme]|uniref:TB2/DP1, HVA22 family-domain-containing protein n=1 Tax=Filobasidium floriforme TaxID=5210 RepID=UPI001E8DC51C|nr:TB2/DP1, HVA22 family-domain-containing protein [Filobasidium floriforme]KAH8081170.1 TB2/DP1, HVA22 family-domain-containing protein [Filobasidium floriforme]